RLAPGDRRHGGGRQHDPDRRERGRRRPRRGAATAYLHGGLMTKRAVLAYSGGLDTSVTVRWLTDQGYDVSAVVVDVGQHDDFEAARERGETAGAVEVRVVRAADRFAEEFVSRAIKANALYEGKYALVSSLARPLIAEEVVRVAKEVGADTLAHGCTGKGNDQVRFEVAFGALAPEMQVIAPVRDPGIPREKAIALAQ